MVASKARRSASTRSGGTSGVVTSGARDRGVGRDECRAPCGRPRSWRAPHQRHVGELGIPLQRDLHQDDDLLLREPLRPRRLPRRPGIRAAAADLAALHREVDVVAAGIAGDDLELGADELVERLGIVDRAAGDAGRADDQLALSSRPGWCVMPVVCQELITFGRVGGVADPEELAHVEFDAGAAESPDAPPCSAMIGMQHGAVLRRHVGEPVGDQHPTGARHVGGDDRRIARDVLADMARDQRARRS